MKRHEIRDETVLARVADYVLGMLSQADSGAFERHLEDCAVCSDELQAQRGLSDQLGAPAPEGRERPELWSRIERKLGFIESPGLGLIESPSLGSGAGRASAETAGEQRIDGIDFRFGRPDDWKPAPLPGIETRILRVDQGGQRVTYEARMQPGAVYPGHEHDGPEECYVISGSLWVGDVLMRAGDYQSVPGGTPHGVQRTDDGCRLLLVSSRADSPLAWS